VSDALSRVQFSEPALDLRQEHQAFNGIFPRGIGPSLAALTQHLQDD
jgi:hypothetical protein